MAIWQSKWRKRRKTGGKRRPYRSKRKRELGRPPSHTKLAPKRIVTVRARGGKIKRRALRLDQGVFSWGSEACARKTRIIDVLYNPASNELVRTKTLTKGTIVVIDATPFRQWYEHYYRIPLGRKKNAKLTEQEEALFSKKKSAKLEEKLKVRHEKSKVEPAVEEQFYTGRVLARIASRPGQVGAADGYVLEGKELEFYLRKIKAKRAR
jgi:small subunit ribosomal protein S8e